jgi:hypothetical protein
MPPKLESYRTDLPVARVEYMYGGGNPRPFLFHESAIAAFYITLDALNQFQKIEAIGGNPYVIPALGLWFLATESYVSTIYKIANIDFELAQASTSPSRSPKPWETERIEPKYIAIEDYFGVPSPRPKMPRSTLVEFATLRNTLFHDLTGVKQPLFTHTVFPTKVENVNEVDLIQAMIISIDVFNYFRFLFPQADVMPSIQLEGTFEKLDILASEIAIPAFQEILFAKGLETDLGLSLGTSRIAAAAPLSLQIVIRTNGPVAPKSAMAAGQNQLIGQRLLREAKERRPVPPDIFHLPGYARP